MSNDYSKFEFYYKCFKNGNYYGAKPLEGSKTIDNVVDICKKLKLKSPIDPDKIHVTLMYSPDIGNPAVYPSSNLVYKAKAKEFKLFGEEENCLVICLESPDLVSRHRELQARGFIHTFNEYEPHITLTYDYQGDLPSADVLQGLEFEFGHEYLEPLDDKWTSNNT